MALQQEDIHQVLRSHLKSQDFQFISCDRSDLKDINLGFLSGSDKARIKYKFQGEEQELHVFIKTLPQSSYRRHIVDSGGSFLREAVLYGGLLDGFRSKLKDNTIPKCLLARSDLIVMEDMTKRGFKNKNLQSTFDLDECEKTLEALAKFHALSFVTERENGRKMPDLTPIIETEVIMSKDENSPSRKAIFVSIKALEAIAEQFLSDKFSEEIIAKAVVYMKNCFDELKSSKLYPNALSHSDMWGNNVMFGYDEEGQLKEVCIIDYQLVTYKSPAYDILLFLHNCTDKQFRDKHYDNLIKHYYEVLSIQLSREGIDIQDLMTWDDFLNSLKESLQISLLQACFFLHFVLMPEDILNDVMISDAKFKEYYEVDRTGYGLEAMKYPWYRRRILEALSNFLDCFVPND